MGTSLEKTVARIAGDGGAAGRRSRALLLDSRSIALGAALSLATLAGCGHRLESDAQAGPSAPASKVTVAEPLAVPIVEATEYTGRAEAVETVDVRPRSTGHLQRAAFHEGDLVKKGDLLFVIDPLPYDVALVRAKAELARARADEELAQRESARAEQLFESRAISERDVDTQRTSLVSLAARTRVAASAVSAAELDVEYAYVRAPISGRIGRIVVTPGNLVAPSLPVPLATIVTVDRLHVYVDVEEARALALGHDPKKAKLARVTFGEDRMHAREAAVDFIDNRVDPQTGTLKVRVVVNNDDGALSPGGSLGSS